MTAVKTSPVPPAQVRFLFVPSDYRLPAVAGWRGPLGFVPDVPLRSHEGFLLRIGPT